MSQTTTAVFLYIGFDNERRKNNSDFPATQGGFLDIPDAMDEMATAVEKWYDNSGRDVETEMPGCFDYEVTEEMGAWLFNNFECTASEFTAELERYVTAWLEEDAKRIALWRENDAKLKGKS